MRILVFGAGASLGSQNQVAAPFRAPLVDQLFDVAYASHARGILTSEDLSFCRNSIGEVGALERWLTGYWDAAERKDAQDRRADLTLFARIAIYLRVLSQSVSTTYTEDNGYAKLLRRLRNSGKRIVLVSFNYDTLLDRAVQDVYGLPLQSLNDYYEFPFFKPHGSVNWLLLRRDVDASIHGEHAFDVQARTRQAAYCMYNRAPFRSGSHRILDPRHYDLEGLDRLYKAVDNHFCYPFLFAPLTKKLYATVEGFGEQLLTLAGRCFSEATEVVLIGYRAADEIIDELLHRVPRGVALTVVDKDQPRSAAVLGDVLKRHPHMQAGTAYGGGFAAYAAGTDVPS